MRFRDLGLVTFVVVFAGCGTTLQPIPPAWLSPPSVEKSTRADLVRAAAGGIPATRPPVVNEPIRIVTDEAGSRLFRGDSPLTPAYRAIESFDVSAERMEIAFSAKRDENFDIGLVAVEGSQVNWIPEDPADEVGPRWAPRGNKASFIVRNRGGDLVRTVHIPTAVQLIVDFPFGYVRDLAWDAIGERFAVAWETADASERIEVMRYGGEARRIATPPATSLDVVSAPFAGGQMLRPGSLTYGERLPLVVWVNAGERNRWDAARGELLRSSRTAVLVLDGEPEDLAGIVTPWVDSSRIFVVAPLGTRPGIVEGATVIAGEASVPRGFYRRSGTLISVHPADVKSFAARFIAEELKGSPPRGR